MLSYIVHVAAALAVAGFIAWSAEPLPWSPRKRVTPSQRVAEASIVGFLMGLAYVFLVVSHDRAASPADVVTPIGLAAVTVMMLFVLIGTAGYVFLHSRVELEKQPAVIAARSNPNRGPRRYSDM